jgi:hypothetical protein
MSLRVYYEVLNQKGSPALFTDTLANRPAFGFQGRLFISTDTAQIYEDTGSAWSLIADATGSVVGFVPYSGAVNNLNLGTFDLTADIGTLNQVKAVGSGGLSFNANSGTQVAVMGAGGGANITLYGGLTGTSANFSNNITVNTLSIGTGSGTGVHNTAFGFNALNVNTTGADNTAIGYSSLPINTGGSSNVAVGAHTLQSNISGSGNVAIGWSTLIIATGNGNVAIGQNSGGDITSGQNNILLGNDTGRGITTGSNNTIIGSISGLSASLSNNIILADGAGNVRYQWNGTNNVFGNPISGTSGTFSGNVTATGLFGFSLKGRASDNFGGIGFYSNDGVTRYGYIQSGSTNGGQIVLVGDGGGDITLDNRGMNVTCAATFNTLGTGLVYSNGGLLTSTNPSDKRLKENINDIKWGLKEILQLRPVEYNWKDDKINQGKQFGFIAQEVQQIIPEIVREFTIKSNNEIENDEIIRLGLEKEGIYVALVKAIQELSERLSILENK